VELFEAIHTRRSIRKYESKKVPDALIEKIIAAGTAAPSARNEQPWHFVVITDRALLEKIPTFSPYASYAKDAPAAILVCGDISLEKINGFWMQDCSACIQNMLLAAHGLGLGAVWTAAYPLEDRVEGYKRLLGISKTEVLPLALVILGYPAQKVPPEDRFKKERIHRNGW
jgi:nitroreductase